jgi:hypothetical protein
MSSHYLVGDGQAFKTMEAKEGEVSGVVGDQPCTAFSLMMKRFSRTLLTIYLMMVVAYAMLQPFVSQSILSYLKAVGIMEK